jgi:uncharacterized protein YecE (DUF72 family)
MLHIGTSGWDYREWKPDFYPATLPHSRFLEHYSERLGACEINATFHRLHEPQSVARWAAAVPESFNFAVKAHRRLTHRKRFALGSTGHQFLNQFLESIAPLEEKLACVLFQFPDYVERDDVAMSELVEALPAGLRFALEFRNDSWFEPEVIGWVAEHGGTICFSEAAGAVPKELPPGPFAYVRLRGQQYSEEVRGSWLELLRAEARSRDVFAFAKHKDVPANDPFTGVAMAEWMAARSDEPTTRTRPKRRGRESAPDRQ